MDLRRNVAWTTLALLPGAYKAGSNVRGFLVLMCILISILRHAFSLPVDAADSGLTILCISWFGGRLFFRLRRSRALWERLAKNGVPHAFSMAALGWLLSGVFPGLYPALKSLWYLGWGYTLYWIC